MAITAYAVKSRLTSDMESMLVAGKKSGRVDPYLMSMMEMELERRALVVSMQFGEFGDEQVERLETLNMLIGG